MIFQQSIETQRRNCGHSCKDGETGEKWPDFVAQSRIVIAEDQEDEHDSSQTEGNGQAGAKQNTVNNCKWAHLRIVRPGGAKMPGKLYI